MSSESAPRSTTDRRMMIAAAFVIVAGVVASIVVATRGGDRTAQGAEVTVPARSNPHAPFQVSKDVLNAIDKFTLTADAASLVAKGRELFRSSEVALDGESCQSCHTEGGANADVGTTPHVIGNPTVDGSFQGLRDPQSLYGVGETDPYFWVGDTATLQEVAVATIQNHFKPAFKMPALSQSERDAEAAALVAYMKTIEAPTSDFDRGTMSDAAVRGLELFQGKAGCVECHGGPNFTDNIEHNTRVPQGPVFNGGPANNDPGRLAPPAGTCPNVPINPLQPLECAFNTPTLRGLVGTAPYMHNGFCRGATGPVSACDTLEKVVEFYNTHSIVAPLGLNTQEQADLVAFLKAL